MEAKYTFRDCGASIEARVFHIESGFSVTLYDLDAHETFPTIRIFVRETDAIVFAQSLVQ